MALLLILPLGRVEGWQSVQLLKCDVLILPSQPWFWDVLSWMLCNMILCLLFLFFGCFVPNSPHSLHFPCVLGQSVVIRYSAVREHIHMWIMWMRMYIYIICLYIIYTSKSLVPCVHRFCEVLFWSLVGSNSTASPWCRALALGRVVEVLRGTPRCSLATASIPPCFFWHCDDSQPQVIKRGYG